MAEKIAQKLRAVAPAYAGREGELTAFLQLTFQTVRLAERGERALADALYQIAAEDLLHMQKLASLIERLGAPPVFSACPPYPVSWYSASCVDYTADTDGMLESDLSLKQNAISAYERMLPLFSGKDRETVEEILKEERSHSDALRALTRRASRA